jgi:hypothetical protein
VCVKEAFPAIKWFSATDQSSPILGTRCYRVDRQVAGVSWRTWLNWGKLAQFLDDFPIPP